MTKRTVWFAGGGTGGHLYPGLAIARALVEADPSIAPLFIGAQRGIERDILPTTEFAYRLLDLHPLYRQRPLRNWRTVRGAIGAWRTLSAEARRSRPEAVVGTGGYAAGVALAWARAHGIPTILHEPDSFPGLTTRVFARGARAIYLGFPEARAKLAPRADADVQVLGAPIVPPPAPVPDRAAARVRWGLPADAFVVLVVGGSQGARALNEAVAAWCRSGLPNGLALIWAPGRSQYAQYEAMTSPMVCVRPYLNPIGEAYAAADVAVSRAGAMSVAELCAWGIPSILVPLPTSAQDHQAFNAKAVAGSGAAVHLPQSALSADTLADQIQALRRNPGGMAAMRDAALGRARPHAAHAMAMAILARLQRHAPR